MIKILCVGKLKEDYLKSLVADYQKRISKYHPLQIIEVKDENNLQEEGKSLQKYINSKDLLICLDINGQKQSSKEFARLIDKSFISYSTITFIIGSSLGLPEDIKKMCQQKISFSDMTFPNGLFRGLLLEQIYRAFKINNNETYHK